MRKNGFTFIEILGVITLLALISVIVLISVDNSLKKSKETLSQAQIESIKSAASMWRTDNIDMVPSSGYYILTLNDLINSGYIDDVIDPNIKNSYDKGILVNIGMNNILVGNEANNYVSNLYGCNNSTIFCIKDRSDMEKLAREVNNGDSKSGKTYKLIKNIDLGGKFDSDGNPIEGNNPWTPIGSEAKPFSGTFDGTGHIITGMYIDSTTIYTGLFSVVSGGTIKNMGIERSYVKSSNENTGGFVGLLKSNSMVINCYNKAKISAKKSVGGIVGMLGGLSTVKNCYNMGEINGNGIQFAGGIVGYAIGQNTTIENCYNSGLIKSGYQPGGIIGGLQGKVLNCYNVGCIISSKNSGGGILGQLYYTTSPLADGNYNTGSANYGIIGAREGSGTPTVANNYFLNTSATYGKIGNSDEGAAPLSASEMPSVISVINGDGAFVPDTKGINNGYPILSWQQ